MPVMDIGHMRMAVDQRRMPVRVGMRLARRIAGFVRMLMVRVMNMPMRMRRRLMRVRMLVALGEM